jgi:hypothetical protein
MDFPFRLRRSRVAAAVTGSEILPQSEGASLVVSKVVVTSVLLEKVGRIQSPVLWWVSRSLVHAGADRDVGIVFDQGAEVLGLVHLGVDTRP